MKPEMSKRLRDRRNGYGFSMRERAGVALLFICAFFLIGIASVGQRPEPLSVTRIFNIKSSSAVIDNRNSSNRRNDYHSFCATGTGSWSSTIQSASASTGPWTSFTEPTATVTNASANCYGAVAGYKPFVRFLITGNASVAYSASREYYIVGQTSSATGNAFSYSTAFTSTTSLSIPTSQHGFASSNLLVTCVDGTGGAIEPSEITIAANGNLVITFLLSQAGTCTVGASPSSFSLSFTNLSSVSITAAQHAQRTVTGLVCLNTSNQVIQTGLVTFTPAVFAQGGAMSASYNITVAFALAQSGRCAVLGV